MQHISPQQPITREALADLATRMFGGLVKGVVDVEKKTILIDAEMHVDLEQVLLEEGSLQESLWGINLYPEEVDEDVLEFDSMINIRPNQNNRTRSVEDQGLQAIIRAIVEDSVTE